MMPLGFPPDRWRATLAVAAAVASLFGPRRAEAIPVFAHRYGLTCQTCHTVVPHLTEFGEEFEAGGFRLPERVARGAVPVAVKVNLQYASEAEAGLPKAVVDEVELLLGGSFGRRGSYFAEQYVVDGGLPGRSRDLWAAWRMGPADAPAATLRAGQFTLALPLDPETFRETTDHYAIWDQTAGANPFTFFAPKIGVQLEGGGERGFGGAIALVQGHDPGSGIATRGIDRHLFARYTARAVTLSAYRYDGVRPVHGGDDRFHREGAGIAFERVRLRLDAVYQRGFDTDAGAGVSLMSSGGFLQARYELSPRLFAIARYDGTNDTAFARALIAGAGYRLARNARFTLFDTIHRDAETGVRRHTLSSALLFAY